MSKIEDLIRRKLIKISYSFYCDEKGQVMKLQPEEYVDPDNKLNIAYKIFSTSFKGDRLNLSCGSIVYSHNYARLPERNNFNGEDYCFDLSENNKIDILPGETVSIPTNERIGVNHDVVVNEKENIYFGAIVLPRLSIADAGLFYVPSYIDPTWDGICQATLKNTSDRPITISIGEHLSVCKFYQIDGRPDQIFLDSFRNLNHHIGKNWQNIFDGSKDPVSRGKKPLPLKEKKKTWELNLKEIKNFLAKNSMTIIGGSFLISIGSIVGILKVGFYDFPKTKEQLEKMRHDISRIPVSQEFEFNVEPGIYRYTETRTLDTKNRILSTIWTKYNDDEINLKYLNVSKNVGTDKCDLTFSFEVLDTFKISKKLKIQVMLSK